MGQKCNICSCTKSPTLQGIKSEKDFTGILTHGDKTDYDTKEIQRQGVKGIIGFYRKQLETVNIARHQVDQFNDVTFELLDDLFECQTTTIEAAIKGQITQDFDNFDTSNRIPCGPLAKLNMACWSHFIMMEGGFEQEPVNDIDCLLIHLKREELRINPYASPVISLLDMDFNIESNSVNFTNPSQTDMSSDFILVRSKTNQRTRSAYSRKHDATQFNIRQAINNKFTNIYQEFSLKWVEKNNYQNPSLRQVVDGLKELFFFQIDQRQVSVLPEKIAHIKQQYGLVFDRILDLVDYEDIDQPMAALIQTDQLGQQQPVQEGLYDPRNPATMLILWFFSIEPSFYDELNHACINMNLELLDQLGPFAKAMSCILNWTEYTRDDKIALGIGFHEPSVKIFHPLGHFNQSFLLYRGASMKPDWIDQWRDCVGLQGLKEKNSLFIRDGNQDKPAYICLQGLTSTSQRLSTALSFGATTSESLQTVVFVINIQNYRGFPGFRLNREEYSSHHSEKEVVLVEGIPMFVLGVEDIYLDLKKSNKTIWQQFNLKTITFIHLCHLA